MLKTKTIQRQKLPLIHDSSMSRDYILYICQPLQIKALGLFLEYEKMFEKFLS